MKSPKIVYVYNRYKNASDKKAVAVEIRITYERKSKYISTGVAIFPKEWKEGKIVGRMDAPYLQKNIDKQYENVCKVVSDMVDEGMFNLSEIPSRLKQLEGKGKSFIEFCEERINVRTYGLKEDTIERYKRFLKFLKDWGKITWFPDVTEENLLLMDKELDNKGMRAKSKWHNYHRFLNSFIIDAMSEGLFKRNPYKSLHLEKGRDDESGIEKHLTREEFKKLCDFECSLPSIERARDLFIFQVWTCLAYVDMEAFDAQKVYEDSKGRKMYTGKRWKTGQQFTFLLMPEAVRILEKYGGVLPVISNQKYNQYLRELSYSAGVNKPISSHWARHTGATLLLNSGVNMEIVAKVLGHSSTKITRAIYAKLLDTTVADAMEKIGESLEQKPV